MIRLKKAALYPYRCMETVQEFDLSGNIIALVGRNEAGKTSVLELLAKSNYYDTDNGGFRFDMQTDYPRKKRRELAGAEKPPFATVLTYEVTGELLEEIRREMILPEQKAVFSRMTNYDGAHQVLDNGFTYDPYVFWEAYASRKAPELTELRKGLAGLHTKDDFNRFFTKVSATLGKPEQAALRETEKFFENPHNWENPINEYVFRTWLLPNIPKFLYYDECSMLPSEICLEQLENGPQTPAKQTARAFLALTGLDTEKILTAKDLSEFQLELEMVQAEISASFLQAWTGNSNLRMELGLERKVVTPGQKKGLFRKEIPPVYETTLQIRIKDVRSMVSLPLTSRSKGFQWFFSFWVWFEAIGKTEQTPFVFLLDEPGLHLHEDAQKNLLDFLQKLSESYQIIYTTHSPFLLKHGTQSVYRLLNGESGTVITGLKEDEQT